jgi:hypothetical protein
MHPELLSSLAAEHRRDLAASLNPGRAPAGRETWPGASRRAARRMMPRFQVSWTHTTLAAVAGRRRGRSHVIIISATRVP